MVAGEGEKWAESGNSEDRATRICGRTACGSKSGFGAIALWRRGLALTEVGRLWEEQVWKEELNLLSDKLNVRCAWSSMWKCKWGVVR